MIDRCEDEVCTCTLSLWPAAFEWVRSSKCTQKNREWASPCSVYSKWIWMHREFVIMRPRGITHFEYVHSSLPTFRRLTIKVEVDYLGKEYMLTSIYIDRIINKSTLRVIHVDIMKIYE